MKNISPRVRISGIDASTGLYARIASLMQEHLDRLGLAPVRGRVAFSDENGPKGGRAMRCAVNVSLPRRPLIHVERTATDQRRAFDGAMAILERELARYRDRFLEEKRHPKKYFAARQAEAVRAPAARRRRSS